MAFTGGGDVIGEASIEITPEINLTELQAAATRMAREFERFTKGIQLQGATRQVQQLTTATQQATRSAAEARAQFVELAIGLEVAGRSITQFVSVPLARFIQSSVSEASHLNEVINQTRVIFGESASGILNWAETLDASLGLSSVQALEANNNFARLFSEVGVGMEESSQFAQALVERIGDLASFTDFPIEQVIQRVTSGLVGETEAVRRLGIILDESVIKQAAYNQGIVEAGGALSTQQKFLLRLQQILAQTSEAQGDAARTADTYAGQIRQLHRNTSELQVAVGQAFLPLFTRLAGAFNSALQGATSLAQAFQEMPSLVRALGLGFTGVLVAVGPLTTILGRLLVIWRTATTLTNGLTAAQVRLTAAMGANTVAARLATTAFTALNRALPLIGLGIAAIALASPIIRDLRGDIEDLSIKLEELQDPTLRTRESFDEAFLNTPELIVQTTDEIARLNGLLNEIGQGGEGALKGIKEQIEGLSGARLENTNTALNLFKELLKQGALGAAEGAIAQFELQNTGGQLNGVIATMNILLQEEITKRRQSNQESQRSSDLLNGISLAAREAMDAQEALNEANDENLKKLKEIAAELKQRAGLEKQRLQAIRAVADAQERLNDATKDVTDAQADYNQLVAEGTVDLEALAQAQERLADAQERAVDAAEALAEAMTPASADELAEAEDGITRAELRLRDVRRENKRAVDELNKSLKETNQIQRISLNLAGLNLDQIRSAVGNARASAEALRQKTEVTEEDNEVQKTAEELADEAIERNLNERDAIRDIADAREELTRKREQGTAQDERVIEAAERLADAQREVVALQDEVAAALQPDPTRVEAVAAAHERVLEALSRQREAAEGVREAERERITTLQEIRIELGFLNADERAINQALIDRYGINEDLAEQQRRFAREDARKVASSALNSLDFDNIGALGRGVAKAAFLSPAMIALLTEHLIQSPGAPLRALLKRIGVPDSLLTGFKDGGVITRPMVANIGEGYKAEAVVPLTNARNAIAALQKGWGYMAPALKQQLAPALAPKLTQRPQAGFSMSHGQGTRRGTPELQTLQAILARLNAEDLGTTNIQAPITLSAPNSDLAARKIERQLRKLQNANRGRPDARMR